MSVRTQTLSFVCGFRGICSKFESVMLSTCQTRGIRVWFLDWLVCVIVTGDTFLRGVFLQYLSCLAVSWFNYTTHIK